MGGSATGGPVSLTSFELDAVEQNLRQAGENVDGPLGATPIAGGKSNLTFLLTDGTHRWVLRMPPRAGRTPSAHDVGREYRVTQALFGSAVPVARPVLHCDEPHPLGSSFAVAEFVEGTAIQSRSALADLDPEQATAAIGALLATLAALHRVDYVEVGLKNFGWPGGYAERQLTRWFGQWDIVGPVVLAGAADELRTRLTRMIPQQGTASIVHGDYRIDNTLLTLDGTPQIAAVVDWELSTIGDPVADVAMMAAYRHPAFDLILGFPGAWSSPDLPDPALLAHRYETTGGVELIGWEFHLALAYFKIGVIAAGIDHRRRAGATSGAGFDTAGASVETYLQLASDTINQAQRAKTRTDPNAALRNTLGGTT